MKKQLFLYCLLSTTLFSSAQNVGVGTVTPIDRFTVQTPPLTYGITHTDGVARLSTYFGSDNAAWIGTPSNHAFRLMSNNNVGLSLGADGKVGIGTMNPTEKLTVQTPLNAYGITHSGGGINVSTYAGSSLNAGFIGTSSNHTLGLMVGNISRMTIQLGGYISMGGSTGGYPENTLEVTGGVIYKNWDGANHQWTLRTNALGRFTFGWNGITLSYIDNATGGYFTTSDIRLKENIQVYKPVLGHIRDMVIATYNYTNNKTHDQTLGLLAQDVAKHFPELVRKVDDKYHDPLLAVDYTKTGVIALKGIQEQQVIIDQLLKRVEELERKNEEPCLRCHAIK